MVGEDEIIVRKNLWDEENRLRAVDLNPDNDEHHNIAVYTYDASGQRILRHIPTRVDVYSNAVTSGQEERDVTMIYPSGLITAKVLNPESWSRDDEPGPGGSLIEPILRYTKHYYIGSERISSATDTRSNVGYFIDNSNYNDFFPVSTVRQISNETVIVAGDALEEVYGSFGLEYTVPAPVVEDDKPHTGETGFFAPQVGWYFFHPDHLGSSSYITNLAGVVSQHMEYLPFGELLVDEHLNSHNSPFKFNAKELDAETGNYYYGARYYDPKWSVWLGVDPMWEIYPSFSPYAYTLQNPVKYIDPTGMTPENPGGGCPDPPCNDYTVYNTNTGIELDPVVVSATRTNKDRTWTSESSIRDYGKSEEQWIADYGMNPSDYTPEMAVAYNDWYNKSAGEERLRDFINRFKFIAYDTGALQSAEEVLQWSIGSNAASGMIGKGISPKAFKYTPRFQGTSSTSSEVVYGYYGLEGTTVKYVGISNNPFTRFKAHLNSGTNRAGLHYETQIKFNSRLEARIWEQQNINNRGLNNLFNQRNEIRRSLWQQYNISP